MIGISGICGESVCVYAMEVRVGGVDRGRKEDREQ